MVGYVRIFEQRRSPLFVKGLITSYTVANARFFDLGGPGNARSRGAE
jgi:hypothetical protein